MSGDNRLKVAFWNVQNLFEPRTWPDDPNRNVRGRGPQSREELDLKVHRLADCINSFFDGAGPDLLGLAEVHTDRILQALAKRLAGDYCVLWEPAGTLRDTGLAVLGRIDAVPELTRSDAYRPSAEARPRTLIVRCKLARSPEPVLFAVNHWKSRRPSSAGPFSDKADREQTADWLGDWLSRSADTPCVIVVGDFNAEPTESPFGELRLRSTRHFNRALGARATPACLYNTAWRFLTEPLTWEQRVRSRPENRPKRSFATGFFVWDQLLVSGRALENGPIRLLEKTVGYHLGDMNSERDRRGVLRPVKWWYNTVSDYRGASDHYPLVAEFEIL